MLFDSIEVVKDIHPDDQMWNSGREWYFEVGQSAIRSIFLARDFAWSPHINKILDLPCGHGRVGRYLRGAFPQSEIAFCDIDRSGVDFCAETFSGTPIYSEPELTKVEIGYAYDLIWVGSLFTHVDLDRTKRWLEFLCSKLSDRGILVSTFHGPGSISLLDKYWGIGEMQVERMKRSYIKTGFGYERYPNMADADYGISISKPETIVAMTAGIPGRVLFHSERMWADNHDVLAFCRWDRSKTWV